MRAVGGVQVRWEAALGAYGRRCGPLRNAADSAGGQVALIGVLVSARVNARVPSPAGSRRTAPTWAGLYCASLQPRWGVAMATKWQGARPASVPLPGSNSLPAAYRLHSAGEGGCWHASGKPQAGQVVGRP